MVGHPSTDDTHVPRILLTKLNTAGLNNTNAITAV
jgi:hypothetical protein